LGGKYRRKQLLGLLGVTLLEAFDSARGINKLLRAGEEGMALGANANAHVLVRGAGFEDAAARAVNHRIDVFRMYLGFHESEPQKVMEQTPCCKQFLFPCPASVLRHR
jgi:hypothetical protein